MNGQPEYNTGALAEADAEPGAVENRLTLNPSDERWKAKVESWEDGQTYPITGGKIRQIAPGEFEVVDLQFGGAEEVSDKGEGHPQGAEDMPPAPDRSGYNNPAIDRLMEQERR